MNWKRHALKVLLKEQRKKYKFYQLISIQPIQLIWIGKNAKQKLKKYNKKHNFNLLTWSLICKWNRVTYMLWILEKQLQLRRQFSQFKLNNIREYLKHSQKNKLKKNWDSCHPCLKILSFQELVLKKIN